jgi:UDP-GlcNAc3NAcA epimerase
LILSIIGNRPQIIKAFVVSKSLSQKGIEEKIIYTWQHYDDSLFLNLVKQVQLTIHHKQDSLINKKPHSIKDYIANIEIQAKTIKKNIDAVIVYGDTHSTLAGALFAKKNGYKLIHIESGERSFNNEMPEELNRISTDYLADLLLCVNEKSKKNLSQSICKGKTKVVGDVMLDALLYFQKEPQITLKNKKIKQLIIDKTSYIYFTLHRQANANPSFINSILKMFEELPYAIVWAIHPRIQKSIASLKVPSNVIIINPVTYFESLYILKNAKAVVTDSGGLQKEAYWCQKKCVTIRQETEWTETLVGGWNTLLKQHDNSQLKKILLKKTNVKVWSLKEFGNGKASVNAANAIQQYLYS